MDRAPEFKLVNPETAENTQSAELMRLSDLDLALIGGGCGEVIFPHNS